MTWNEAIAYVTERFLGDLSCDSLTQEEAEVIAKMRLAATAEDVRKRRLWYARPQWDGKWGVMRSYNDPLRGPDGSFFLDDDPDAALVEADKWYKANVTS